MRKERKKEGRRTILPLFLSLFPSLFPSLPLLLSHSVKDDDDGFSTEEWPHQPLKEVQLHDDHGHFPGIFSDPDVGKVSPCLCCLVLAIRSHPSAFPQRRTKEFARQSKQGFVDFGRNVKTSARLMLRERREGYQLTRNDHLLVSPPLSAATSAL